MAFLLLIEGNRDHQASLARVLERAGFTVRRHDAGDILPRGALSGVDAVIAGAGILERNEVLQRLSSTPLIIVDRSATVRQAVRAMKLGAFDYLPAPPQPHELLASVNDALATVTGDSHASTAVKPSFPMIGSCTIMRELQGRIDKVAPTDASVLIVGELGTGKELAARALHAASRRNQAPLITVSCAAIPESLIEQELFGHRDPASGPSHGLLEAADGGTLLLDEVGELPLPAQARLSQFLTNNETQPTGAGFGKALDTRIVATSHLDLKQLTENGRFRDDLYYRLNVVSIALPPLRDRDLDALELAEHILTRVCDLLGKPRPELSVSARDAIAAYYWPGNIRELENVIERAAILCDGNLIEPSLLAIDTRPREDLEESGPASENVSLEEYFVRFVRENEDHLTETELAARLGISRKSLWERRQRLGIPRKKIQKRGLRRP